MKLRVKSVEESRAEHGQYSQHRQTAEQELPVSPPQSGVLPRGVDQLVGFDFSHRLRPPNLK